MTLFHHREDGWLGTVLLCLLTLSALQGAAQPVATRMTAGRTPEGVVYFLPKTALQFNLLIEKKTYQPGYFAKYAERYLRLTGVGQEEEVTHSIAGYRVTQIGVRDTSKCYAVQLKGGKCETADIRLSPDGVLLAVNDEPAAQQLPEPFRPAPHPQAADPRQYLGADVLAAGSVAKMAELTVQHIIELQEHRQQLITGEADNMPQDEQQLRLMIEQIDQERAALMSMFTGSTRRDTTEQVVVVCPKKEVQREVIFRLSERLGLVDKDDLSGTPYYMTVEDLHHTTVEKYGLPEGKNGGFYVNVPSRVRLTLQCERQLLGSFDIYAAQFGFVALRSGSLFKRYVTHMTLNPATGAVEKFRADMPARR